MVVVLGNKRTNFGSGENADVFLQSTPPVSQQLSSRKVVSLIGSFRLRDRPFTCCAATPLIGHCLIIANTCMTNIRSNIKYSVIPFIDRAYSEASHNDRRAIATVSSGNQTKQFPMKFNSFDTAAVTLMLHSPRLPSPIAISIFDSIIARTYSVS